MTPTEPLWWHRTTPRRWALLLAESSPIPPCPSRHRHLKPRGSNFGVSAPDPPMGTQHCGLGVRNTSRRSSANGTLRAAPRPPATPLTPLTPQALRSRCGALQCIQVCPFPPNTSAGCSIPLCPSWGQSPRAPRRSWRSAPTAQPPSSSAPLHGHVWAQPWGYGVTVPRCWSSPSPAASSPSCSCGPTWGQPSVRAGHRCPPVSPRVPPARLSALSSWGAPGPPPTAFPSGGFGPGSPHPGAALGVRGARGPSSCSACCPVGRWEGRGRPAERRSPSAGGSCHTNHSVSWSPPPALQRSHGDGRPQLRDKGDSVMAVGPTAPGGAPHGAHPA